PAAGGSVAVGARVLLAELLLGALWGGVANRPQLSTRARPRSPTPLAAGRWPPLALVCGAALKGFATVNNLLTPTPAPIEIATWLEDRRLAGRRGRMQVGRRQPVWK